MENYLTIDIFLGLKIKKILVDSSRDEIYFETDNNKTILMFHNPSCCENVNIYLYQDLTCIINNTIEHVDEFVSDESYDKTIEQDHEDFMWTFITFHCNHKTARIVWFGSSNGYYDMGVELKYIEKAFDEVLKTKSNTCIEFL